MFRWQLKGACPLSRANAHTFIERAIQDAGKFLQRPFSF
jgi:hypothetical protein